MTFARTREGFRERRSPPCILWRRLPWWDRAEADDIACWFGFGASSSGVVVVPYTVAKLGNPDDRDRWIAAKALPRYLKQQNTAPVQRSRCGVTDDVVS